MRFFEGLSARVNRIFAWADRVQRRHGLLGFPYAVIKKYGDDDGGREAALITYYGFLSIFPLLLLGVRSCRGYWRITQNCGSGSSPRSSHRRCNPRLRIR